MARTVKPGIFVMEGKWSSRARDVRSVSPVLQALDAAGRARYVHHHLNDRDDFHRQLKRWGQGQHEPYGIGYVALHGSPGRVHIGRQIVDLFSLWEVVPPRLLKQKILHFGSCSVLDLDADDRAFLLECVGARALTGFTTDVDWFESMAFELLLFDALTSYKRPSDAEKYLRRTHGEFAERLGFVMVR